MPISKNSLVEEFDMKNARAFKSFLSQLTLASSLLSSPSCVASEIASEARWITVCDGRAQKVKWDMSSDSRPVLTNEEANVLKSEAAKCAKQWEIEPYPEPVEAIALLSGTFTSPGKKQRLILYRYYESPAVGYYGLLVFEGGRLQAHFGFQNSSIGRVAMLPDLNKNGRSELSFESWNMHQGYRHGEIRLLELNNDSVKKFGFFEFADDDLNKNVCFKYVLKAQPAQNPVFLSEKFQKRKNKWTLLKSEKPARLIKDEGYDQAEFVNFLQN